MSEDLWIADLTMSNQVLVSQFLSIAKESLPEFKNQKDFVVWAKSHEEMAGEMRPSPHLAAKHKIQKLNIIQQ